MKLNRKGFMMAEVVVVSVIICTVLVTLYTSLVRINNAYDTRNRYYDINTFKSKVGLRVVALKLSVLVRAEAIVSSQNIDQTKTFNLFGVENLTGLSGTLANQTAANRIPRQVYIATIAIRNGLGKSDD